MKKRDIATRAISVILSVTLAAANCPVYSLAEDVDTDMYVEEASENTVGEELLEDGIGEEPLIPDTSENEITDEDELLDDSPAVWYGEAEESQTEDGSLSDSFVETVEELDILDDSAELLNEDAESTEAPAYVMMNIPYDKYYTAVTGVSDVDAVSSATDSKWKKQAGTYYTASESGVGGQILGVTVPVTVDADGLKAVSAREVDSNDIKTAGAYSYYVPDVEGDEAYLLAMDANGRLSAPEDVEINILNDATAEIAYTSKRGDYQVYLDGIEGIGTIYGATLKTEDDRIYPLRHLQNIYKTELGWSVGVTQTDSKGNLLSWTLYEDMPGKTIQEITYYTSKGIYKIPTSLPVKIKTGVTVKVEDGAVGAGSVGVTFSEELPEDFAAGYTVEGLETSYSEGKLSYTEGAAGGYTLTVSDANGKYCDLTASFILSTEELPARYDAGAHGLVVEEGFTKAQFAAYLQNISEVSVNGKAYPASGKKPVAIIDSNGGLNFFAASEEGAVFEGEGEYEISVSAQGYTKNLKFTAVPAPKYGTMTMSYAEFYNGLAEGANEIDAVSSATTGKSTMFGNADSTEVTDDGYQILGVKKVPVAVEPGASGDLVKRVDFKENAYEKDADAQYWKVDAKGISMDTASLRVADTVTDAKVTLSTSSNWGEYEITVKETSTNHLRNKKTDEGFDVGSGILGILVKTKDGSSYGLTHLKNIWVQPYKFAFSPSKSTALAGLVNKKISSITYIMTDAVYVYEVEGGLYIKPAYAVGTITGAFSEDRKTFTLDEQATGLDNAAITVTYKEGRDTKTLLPSTEVGTETVFTLETAVPENTVPAVTISSDNYADITVSYPMFAFQKEKLETLTARAEALLVYNESDILKAHVGEAKELLENTSGTAQAAAELITELTSLIGSAEKALALEVDGKDVSSLISMSSLWNEETGSYDLSGLDLTDTNVFAEGAEGAYLFTLGDNTVVVGDTTLARWEGSWENWQLYVKPSAAVTKRYPLLDEVWDLAYDGYIAAFAGTPLESYIRNMYPDTDSLKEYWYGMTNTYSEENAATVNNIKIQKTDGGYVLSWLDASGRTLAKSDYRITGKLNKGLEGATMYVLTAQDLAEGSPFQYLVTMEPDYETTGAQPVAGHYHFQYGSSLETLLNYGELYTGTATNIADIKWYATMTNSDASDIAKYNVILSMHRTNKWTEGDLRLAKAELAETTYTADGSVRRPEVVSVKTASGRVVPEDYYKVSYGTPAKEPGTYTVTITAKDGYEGSVTATFTITAKAASSGQSGSSNGGTNICGGTGTTTPAITVKNATKLKVKSTAKKKVKVSWKKRSGVSGYQIQYSTSKKFKKATTKKVSAKKSSYTIKKLKSKKTYYVRIRTYKTVDGKKYYSSWSKAKKVKVK